MLEIRRTRKRMPTETQIRTELLLRREVQRGRNINREGRKNRVNGRPPVGEISPCGLSIYTGHPHENWGSKLDI
jgi:hypothetical protein